MPSSSPNPAPRNPFVETALAFALTYVSAVSPAAIAPRAIDIYADDDYYSASEPSASPWAAKQRKFRGFGVDLANAHKTGLGSSAALVTAFTAAVLVHHLPGLSLQAAESKAKLHNLAQAAHCAAQGKVGSGFDVAAAVYGSCLYRRFSPHLLAGLGEPGTDGFPQRLQGFVDGTDASLRLDAEIQPKTVAVPNGIRLVMCDVDCGSQTVGMVKQVLAWRAEKPDEARVLWQHLQQRNEALATELARLDQLQQQAPEQFADDLAAVSTGAFTAEQAGGLWESGYTRLRESISAIRADLRAMSAGSGVPIEPSQQTELLDACSAVTGVLGGVVPGAGGFDAIALLVADTPAVLDGLSRLVEAWKPSDEHGQGSKVGRVRPLAVREEMEGVRDEDEKLYGLCE